MNDLFPNESIYLSHSPLRQLIEGLPGEEAQRIKTPSLIAPVQLASLYGHKVSAGFPSPADDYIEAKLDLNQLLVRNKAATFFLRVKGDSMINAGIHDGDIIVVDRSITPTDRSVVVAVIDSELTVKRLVINHGIAELHAENPRYAPLRFKKGQELTIWGVVTSAVHTVK
ncbi:MAG: LexA family protein [Sulfuriferula sp.]